MLWAPDVCLKVARRPGPGLGLRLAGGLQAAGEAPHGRGVSCLLGKDSAAWVTTRISHFQRFQYKRSPKLLERASNSSGLATATEATPVSIPTCQVCF